MSKRVHKLQKKITIYMNLFETIYIQKLNTHLVTSAFVIHYFAPLKYPAIFHSFVLTYVGLCGCRQRLGFGQLYLGGRGVVVWGP